jgi:hypothetical protein
LLGEGDSAAPLRELERLTEMLACLGAVVSATQRCAEVRERVGVLEPRRRRFENGDRLPEMLKSIVAAFDQSEDAESAAERARCSPRSCELDLLLRESKRFRRFA